MDSAGLAILIVFVCYQYLESFQEALLLCQPLLTNTSGAEIFKLIDEFFTVGSIPWDNCIDVCTDSAKGHDWKDVRCYLKNKTESQGVQQ